MNECDECGGKAAIIRPAAKTRLCVKCFSTTLEDEVYSTCVKHQLFDEGDKVAIGVSGGKDSSVLAEILFRINARYEMGLDLKLLAIDEGITGYRDDSLEVVKQNQKMYSLP
ncbi:MAG: hypothetical protein KVP17_002419 [Porospora cf. gigantea B]|uniref:uncharacterized protein n=1 Tax=Porospora cf. gigantea B TaxID=2853592 RepID=UPI003571D1A9|nr:MAG: hypothetical protein KVP17_002419 [Porospora cf. gigantea B]